MSARGAVVEALAQVLLWGGLAAAIVFLAVLIVGEVRVQMSDRLRIRREVLKAQRQIHSLAVAAFAEMLDDARIGRLDVPEEPASAPVMD